MLARPVCHMPVKLSNVTKPAVFVGKHGFHGPFRVSHRMAKGPPLLLISHGDSDPFVLASAGVVIVGGPPRVPIALGQGYAAGHLITEDRLSQHGSGRLQLGHLHHLTLSGAAAMAESGHCGQSGMNR